MVVYSVAAEWRGERAGRGEPAASEEGCEMSSRRYPPKGAEAKRKTDGLAGTVYVSSAKRDLVAVRWTGEDGTGTLLYNAEQFARDWELKGKSGAKWRMRAGAIALAAMVGIGLYGAAKEWESLAASRGQAATRQQGNAGTGADGRTLHDNDGALAARACSTGADAYVRSIAGDRFRWIGADTPDKRFNGEVAVHVAPGITTSVSDKLLLEDRTGAFKRVELVCSYNSEENEVLKYWVANGGE